MRQRLLWAMLWAGISSISPIFAWAELDDDRLILQDPTLTLSSGPIPEPSHRLALGINYLGGQARWSFTSRWAAEFQYQTGKASSDFGKVRSDVFGVRAYRHCPRRRRTQFYFGPELAYTKAQAENSGYRVNGVVLGAFGGFDYYLARRISLGTDIGPYLISLKEQNTNLSQNSLDFVINTTLNWHLL